MNRIEEVKKILRKYAQRREVIVAKDLADFQSKEDGLAQEAYYQLFPQPLPDEGLRGKYDLSMKEKLAIQEVVCKGCLGCADGCEKLYDAYLEEEINKIQKYWFGHQAYRHKATEQILALLAKEYMSKQECKECQAQTKFKIEEAKRQERERIIEWARGDCPHRIMAGGGLDGKGNISLRTRAECPECWQALSSGEEVNKK